MSKAKYLEDAALVIDGRVKALEKELERDIARGVEPSRTAPDRAAIMEAKYLARLIRALKSGRYSDPYAYAKDRWNKGQAN